MPGIDRGSKTGNLSGQINLDAGLILSGTGTVSLDYGSLSTNSLLSNVSGGAVTTGSQYVGSGGTGSFSQSGGTNTANYNLYLGNNVSDVGTYNLSGSGQLSCGIYEFVGYSGSGTFVQLGGLNKSATLSIGHYSGGNGNYVLASGTCAGYVEILGNSGTGNFTHTGGTNSFSYLYLGNSSGGSGAYSLSGPGQLLAGSIYVGNSGSGTFTQTGGTISSGATTPYLYIGYGAGGSGLYNLSGSGQMTVPNQFVGTSGTGTFYQSGGINTGTNLYLGFNAASAGTYNLSGSGLLSTFYSYIGSSGTGVFQHSGGTNSVFDFYLGRNAGSSGSYSLGGSGYLSVPHEYIGSAAGGTGSFQQTGGTNSTVYLDIAPGSKYQLAGGTLQIAAGYGLLNSGIFDGLNGSGLLSAAGNVIIDLSQGSLVNTGSMSVSIGSNSLFIVPAGFDTSTDFAKYTTLGLTHTAGTTLSVLPGQSFAGTGTIIDHVSCQGAISGAVSLAGGLNVAGTGNVSLSSGTLTCNDQNSGINSGSLSTEYQFVGSGGTGIFNQTGGTVTFNSSLTNTGLFLGNNAGDVGVYTLSGSGQVSASGSEYVGVSGSGSFIQSGAANLIPTNNLVLADSAGGYGTYNLSPSGLLSASSLIVGWSGTGQFTQSGGTANFSSSLLIGNNTTGVGTFNLNSGSVASGADYVGYSGTGTFVQSSGTHTTAALHIGYESGSNGIYDLNGGRLIASFEYIGSSGAAQFAQFGGTNVVTAALNIGSQGIYNLDGGLLNIASFAQNPAGSVFNLNGGTLQISSGFSSSQLMTFGSSGGATFDTAGYTVTLTGSISGPGGLTKLDTGTLVLASANSFAGDTLIKNGTLAVTNSAALQDSSVDSSGGGTLSFGTLTSATFGGLTGAGSLNLVNTSSTAVVLSVGNNNINSTYSGALKGSGSLIKIGTGSLLLTGSNSYSGTTAIKNGTLEAAGTASIPSYASSGKLTVGNGGLLIVAVGGSGWSTASIGALLSYNGNGFAAGSSLGIDTTGGSIVYTSVLTGNMGLTKIGSQPLVLTASNTYSGATLINQGEVEVNGALASAVIVNSGGILAGTRSLTSVTVEPGGILSPGDAPGSLNLSGGLTLLAGATMDYQLDTNVDSDEIFMPSGILALNNQQFSDFNFTPLADFGDGTYTLFDAGSIVGALGPNTSGTIDGLPADIAIQNDNLVLIVAPEPGTLALLITAVVGLASCAGRKNKCVFKKTETCSWSAAGLPPLCKTACAARRSDRRIDFARIEKRGQSPRTPKLTTRPPPGGRSPSSLAD